jgi:uncharacterized membrane protein
MKRAYFFAAILLTFATLLVTLFIYPRLPAQIATHWNFHGVVDGYGSKNFAAFIMPAVMVGLLVLFRALSWLSPKSFEVDTFRPTYDYIMFLVITLMAYMHFVVLWAGVHPGVNVSRFFLSGLFLFFALMGNVLGKVRRNFWMGVRTPWTLASERVWNDTHRFAARIFVLVGLLGLVVTIAGGSPLIAFLLLLLGAIVSVGYSLMDYKQLEKRGQL